MRATLKLSRRVSYAEYLSAEQMSGPRHEFLDGVVVMMAGGSDEHNAITNQVAWLMRGRQTGACRSYSPDQRFWIAVRRRARYADGSIICGPPEHPPHDDQATINPLVVIEVMSPSSEGDDDGDKREDFQSFDSLLAYVLVAQDARRVKVYRRGELGWEATTYKDGSSFELPSLSSPIEVGEVYDGILDEQGRSLLRG
jgi:Uma2 family endonuclease